MITNKNYCINFFLTLIIFFVTDIGFSQVNKNKYINELGSLNYILQIKFILSNKFFNNFTEI